MSYTIPDEDTVREVMLRVLHEKPIVESQAELTREIMKHLKRINTEFSISGKRVRKIALRTKSVHVEIRCKTTRKEVDVIEKCPVCGEPMTRIENMTLEGKRIITGYKCTFCTYWTGKMLRVPTRYIFRLD